MLWVAGAVLLGLFAVSEHWKSRDLSASCTVVWVIDGDTVKALCPGRGIESIRLTGFDTPEIYSPRCVSEWWRGTVATGALAWAILTAEHSRLELSGRDRYDRGLGRLDLDGEPVSRAMIAAGHARPYSGGRRLSWCEA